MTPDVIASAVPVNPGCFPPTEIRTAPGSTTRVPSGITFDNCRGESLKLTALRNFPADLRLLPVVGEVRHARNARRA